jgi:hypothetical protein
MTPTDLDYRTKAFEQLRTENFALLAKLEEAQKRITDFENQTADQAREIISLKSDLSAVGRDSTEALENLKDTDAIIAKSIQAELERVRTKLKATTEERDMHKSQLVEVILAKEQLSKLAQDGKVGDATDKDGDAPEGRKPQEKIEKLRERLVERNKVSTATTCDTSCIVPSRPKSASLGTPRRPEPVKFAPQRVHSPSLECDISLSRPGLRGKPQSMVKSPSHKSKFQPKVAPSLLDSECWAHLSSSGPNADMVPRPRPTVKARKMQFLMKKSGEAFLSLFSTHKP